MWISKKKYEESIAELDEKNWEERRKERQENFQDDRIRQLAEDVKSLKKEVKQLKKQIREGY
jgi:RNA polymerase-interacting CarD/CdnL/TRCF family regulator